MKRVFEHEELDIGYDDLVADTRETGRVYVAPDGSRYPSVTTVLGILSEDSIREWRQRVGEEKANSITRKAASRGTDMHTLVEHYLKNESLPSVQPLSEFLFKFARPSLDKINNMIWLIFQYKLYLSYKDLLHLACLFLKELLRYYFSHNTYHLLQ